jgi:hypothetical protein
MVGVGCWSEGRGKYSDRNKSGDNGKEVRFFIVILGGWDGWSKKKIWIRRDNVRKK